MSSKLDNVIWEAVKFKIKCDENSDKPQDYEALIQAISEVDLLPGEPIFCLRAKDRIAPATINYWIIMAERDGAVSDNLNSARQALHAMEAWQADITNMMHVKVPT